MEKKGYYGTFLHNLDDKKRLSMPAKFSFFLSPKVYLSRGFNNGCLELRDEDSFNKKSNDLNNSLDNENLRTVKRFFFADTSDIEMDKAKRILIPDNLLQKSGIKREITIIGIGDYIEIWDKAKYDAWYKENEKKYLLASESINSTKK